jgi:copper oxidase (laccase) domain-containing protein
MLDLPLANKIGLQKAGVMDIEVLDICTKCNDSFYSYRREGRGVNTQLSFIALKRYSK